VFIREIRVYFRFYQRLSAEICGIPSFRFGISEQPKLNDPVEPECLVL